MSAGCLPSVAIFAEQRIWRIDTRQSALSPICTWPAADRLTATSDATPQSSEPGDTSVGIGRHAGVLQALGLLDGLSQVADISNDRVGQALATTELPKHVHSRAALGKISGNPAILHESEVAISSAARDLRADNDILPALSIDKLADVDLVNYSRNGL